MKLFNHHQKRRGILLESALDGGEQCASCDAACCKGFPSVELSAQEYETLDKLGGARLTYTLTGHCYLIIENGCDFLHGNRCGIYDLRPDICRRFTCRTL